MTNPTPAETARDEERFALWYHYQSAVQPGAMEVDHAARTAYLAARQSERQSAAEMVAKIKALDRYDSDREGSMERWEAGDWLNADDVLAIIAEWEER